MTEDEAQEMLSKHYKQQVMPVNNYCNALRIWADLMKKRKEEFDTEEAVEFDKIHRSIDVLISKSCLLDRMLYCGEKPSQTPCPVHKGVWSGVHLGWPNTFWTNFKTGEKTPVEVSEQCREWYDAGCRCFQHQCGCTTGWQPDKHCGCIKG